MVAHATWLGLHPARLGASGVRHELANRGLGFVPHGLAKLENLWAAPLAGYDFAGVGQPKSRLSPLCRRRHCTGRVNPLALYLADHAAPKPGPVMGGQ